MKRKYIIIISLIIVAIVLILIFANKGKKSDSVLVAEVEKGRFEVLVTTTGELQAKESVEIRGPQGLRNRRLGIREVKIIDLVPEGTVVDSGDYVARLDKTETLTKLKDAEDELEKRKSEYIKTKLDTAMKLKQARNELIDLEFAVEEKKIAMKESKYEPPTTQRQAKYDFQKAKRQLKQAKENYQLQVEQAEAEMKEATINLDKQQRTRDKMAELVQQFTIYAPQSGMVIYERNWNGEKQKEGSTISPWNLTVATLPDLSTYISKTYVNEIDISKVNRGQKVRIKVDAFPNRKYTGKVTEVANVGQELKSTGAKVFEVIITMNESDSIIRPAMTTTNEIVTSRFSDVKYLPLESIFQKDTMNVVYTADNEIKQVELGVANENHIIVEKGLKEGEEVYLTVPENKDNFKFVSLESKQS
jgi:multidrug resistance efflux pump